MGDSCCVNNCCFSFSFSLAIFLSNSAISSRVKCCWKEYSFNSGVSVSPSYVNSSDSSDSPVDEVSPQWVGLSSFDSSVIYFFLNSFRFFIRWLIPPCKPRVVKKNLGTSGGSLIHVIYNDLGKDKAADYLNNAQGITNNFLLWIYNKK